MAVSADQLGCARNWRNSSSLGSPSSSRNRVTDATAPGGAATAPFCSPQERRFVLVAAILASSLGFIDGSVVAIAIPAIRSDIGATLVDAQWISNAYALTLSALHARRRGGRRHIRTARAPSSPALPCSCRVRRLRAGHRPGDADCGRVAAGRGRRHDGAMQPGHHRQGLPRDQRGWAIGMWASSSALTSALGPTIGGAVLAAFDDSVWRVLFAVNVPLGGPGALPARGEGAGRRAVAAAADRLGGAALATAAFGAIAYG